MGDKLTITEALAEIKTIGKRLAKKSEFIQTYCVRPDCIKDPLEREGGSVANLAAEAQSMRDLHTRLVRLRHGIQAANVTELVTIGNKTMCIADWLVWRREVAPLVAAHLNAMNRKLADVRKQAIGRGLSVVTSPSDVSKTTDMVVAVNEKEMAQEAEDLESALGKLDGILSLKNATVFIEA